MGLAWTCETSQPISSDTLTPNSALPPNTSQVVPLPGDQTFQMYQPMGGIYSNHHNSKFYLISGSFSSPGTSM